MEKRNHNKPADEKSEEQSTESLLAEINELTKKHSEAVESLQAAEAVVEELQAKLDSKPAVAPSSLPMVKHKGVEYQFTCGKFWLNNEEHTAEAAAKDKDLIAELIEMGFGCLVEV